MEWMIEIQRRIAAMTPQQRLDRMKEIMGSPGSVMTALEAVEYGALYLDLPVVLIWKEMAQAMVSGELSFGVPGPKGEYVPIDPAGLRHRQ